MVIGRACNGGWTGVAAGELAGQGYVPRKVEDAVAENPCLDIPYNTARSQFWCFVREVAGRLGVADIEQPGWPSHLIWSNLYKASPAKGGNPSSALVQAQLSECLELFKLELDKWRPRPRSQ
jgi:hypothetical protein